MKKFSDTDDGVSTTNTPIELPTPFYRSGIAAYRWINPTGASIETTEFSQLMLYCIQDLINLLGPASPTSTYPSSTYTCDRYHPAYFLMHDITPPPRWLTYQRIINIIVDLTASSDMLLEGEVYNSPFEVWVPPSIPLTKVVSGVWTQDLSNDNLTFNVKPETTH